MVARTCGGAEEKRRMKNGSAHARDACVRGIRATCDVCVRRHSRLSACVEGVGVWACVHAAVCARCS
eukprot:6174112-Pleurochrysis_carterae.AAC.1